MIEFVLVQLEPWVLEVVKQCVETIRRALMNSVKTGTYWMTRGVLRIVLEKLKAGNVKVEICQSQMSVSQFVVTFS